MTIQDLEKHGNFGNDGNIGNPHSFDAKSFPKLRPGVKFFRINEQINPSNPSNAGPDFYVGFSHRGIELKIEIAPQLLQLLDGSHSLDKILQAFSINANNLVVDVLQMLHAAKLIEFRKSALRLEFARKKTTSGEMMPVNLVNTFNRMQAEENLSSWHPTIGIERSAETLIGERRSFSVLIYGRNRLALSLFSVLQASGFGTIKVTDRLGSTNIDSLVQIEPNEVCGLAIRGSDVGMRKTLVLADLARNSQLFVGENLLFPMVPNFIISTESVPQEIMQGWMSEAIPHLLISNLTENKIVLGPIVLPGISPCLNCLNLWRAEQFPHHNLFELLVALDSEDAIGLEIPSAQVAFLTGLVATYLIEFCAYSGDGNVPKLIGSTLTLNLFEPLGFENESVGYRYWQPHLSCGCQRLI
jgi:hypothetical protein